MHRDDNLTTFRCRLSWNLGASASCNPLGLSRPVMGLLYLFAFSECIQYGITYCLQIFFLLKIEVLEFIDWMYLFKTLHRPEDGSLEPKHVVKLCIINYILCCVWLHTSLYEYCSLQLKCDGTRWSTGREVKGKLANGVSGQYSSHYLGTWFIQHYYRWCAHLGCQ